MTKKIASLWSTPAGQGALLGWFEVVTITGLSVASYVDGEFGLLIRLSLVAALTWYWQEQRWPNTAQIDGWFITALVVMLLFAF